VFERARARGSLCALVSFELPAGAPLFTPARLEPGGRSSSLVRFAVAQLVLLRGVGIFVELRSW